MNHLNYVPVRNFWDILRSNEWLGDEHVTRFEGLLRSNTMFEPRGCVFKEIPSEIRPIPRDRDHIEILQSGDNERTGHWTCFYYSCDEDQIHMFDSGSGRKLVPEQEAYIRGLLPDIIHTRKNQSNLVTLTIKSVALIALHVQWLLPCH